MSFKSLTACRTDSVISVEELSLDDLLEDAPSTSNLASSWLDEGWSESLGTMRNRIASSTLEQHSSAPAGCRSERTRYSDSTVAANDFVAGPTRFCTIRQRVSNSFTIASVDDDRSGSTGLTAALSGAGGLSLRCLEGSKEEEEQAASRRRSNSSMIRRISVSDASRTMPDASSIPSTSTRGGGSGSSVPMRPWASKISSNTARRFCIPVRLFYIRQMGHSRACP